jgi:hypothetical protein
VTDHNYGCGTIFEVTSVGKLDTLYNFCSQTGCGDGVAPSALIQATDGNLYGTNEGTIFQFSSTGKLATLARFGSWCDFWISTSPFATLQQATSGIFYGTTFACVDDGFEEGSVYTLSMGLAPFVAANPTFGSDGWDITILGNNLTGATSVTFNGAAATFTVVSDTYIAATVPSGATTGTIEVTTPGGTLSSNVAFRVLP